MIITYKELSSLTKDLGFSAKALYTASNHVARHYHRVKIPKGNNEYRVLSVPDDFLKAIQKSIAEKLLSYEEVSPYATAYRYGASTVRNAMPHLKNETVLKLDIRHFFDHIIYPLVKEKVFDKKRYSEKNRVLLTLICLYKDALPQGAPTSPFISNIIMRDFDNYVGEWCAKRNISYTRYCDDMTFSGAFSPQEVIPFVKQELRKMGFYLNDKKTAIARSGQKQVITGILVNEKLNVPSAYRKKLRQELYYCKKYGVDSHLKHQNIMVDARAYVRKLLGKVNYVLSVDKKNVEMSNYKDWLTKELKK